MIYAFVDIDFELIKFNVVLNHHNLIMRYDQRAHLQPAESSFKILSMRATYHTEPEILVIHKTSFLFLDLDRTKNDQPMGVGSNKTRPCDWLLMKILQIASGKFLKISFSVRIFRRPPNHTDCSNNEKNGQNNFNKYWTGLGTADSM